MREQQQLSRQLRDISDPFRLPEETFRSHYRLSKEAARFVFLEIQDNLEIPRRRTGVNPVLKFLATLHFFAFGSYQKSIGKDRHSSMSQPNISRAIHAVVDVICNILDRRYIKFPQNLEQITAVKNGFYEKYNLPGVMGCIDCTHIHIVPPAANDPIYPGHVYINRKNVHSINCQIICDSDAKILAINARFPGSVHDAAIWMSSNIKTFLLNRFRNGDRTSWLIGDSGYPLQPFLLTPIVGAAAGTPQARYTEVLKTAGNGIKRCNGYLKGTFRCLRQNRVLYYKPAFAAKIVYSCAVLHNIRILWNINDDNDNYIEADDDNDEVDANVEYGNNDNLFQMGIQIRDNLIRQFFHNQN